jgi:hypothetical protein
MAEGGVWLDPAERSNSLLALGSGLLHFLQRFCRMRG